MNLKEWNQRGYWLAALSNGHTVLEPSLFDVKDRTSPWNKLITYIKEKNLHITNLRYCLKGRIYNLPSKSNKPFKFAHSEVVKPKGYNYFTTAFSETNIVTGEQNSSAAKRLEAHFNNYKLCLYIDTKSGESWVVIENVSNNEKTF